MELRICEKIHLFKLLLIQLLKFIHKSLFAHQMGTNPKGKQIWQKMNRNKRILMKGRGIKWRNNKLWSFDKQF